MNLDFVRWKDKINSTKMKWRVGIFLAKMRWRVGIKLCLLAWIDEVDGEHGRRLLEQSHWLQSLRVWHEMPNGGL